MVGFFTIVSGFLAHRYLLSRRMSYSMETEIMQVTPRKRSSARKTSRRRRFDFIAFIGELLITAGLLGCLFAFWDVYVTDWQVANFKQQALKDFKQEIKSCPARVSQDIRTDQPPTPLLKDSGQAMGALHIPRWNYMVLPIKEGTAQPILDSGAAGHYSLTALPGQIGNFSVAAHRLSYGSSFNQIETLADQDPVVVETPDAWIIYKVDSREIVKPDAVQVIAPVPNRPLETPTERFMTMTTCHPEYGNWERFIVHLKFSHWIPRNSGIPQELAAGGKACTD